MIATVVALRKMFDDERKNIAEGQLAEQNDLQDRVASLKNDFES